MGGRLYQLGFGEEFGGKRFLDVTPKNYRVGKPYEMPERHVREVKDRIVVSSPAQVAEYLMTRIYTPFEQFDQEEFWTLLLNTKNMVTRASLHSIYARFTEGFAYPDLEEAAALLGTVPTASFSNDS
jgi:hypothetical protein